MYESKTVENSSPASALLGHVLSVSGSRAALGLLPTGRSDQTDFRTTVGRLVRLQCGQSIVLGVLTEIKTTPTDALHYAVADVDLVGEITLAADGTQLFHRGVNTYPAIGDAASASEPQDRVLVGTGSTTPSCSSARWRAAISATA